MTGMLTARINLMNSTVVSLREGGDIALFFLHKSPKFCNKVFLFIGLTTLKTLVNFDWLIQ